MTGKRIPLTYKHDDPIPYMQCTVCAELKQLTDFHKDRTTCTGYEYRCKVCKSNASKERRIKNHTVTKPLKEYKRCTKCRLVKPIIMFGKDIGSSDGFDIRCKDCSTHKSKAYWEKVRSSTDTLDRARAYNRQWYLDNPEKVFARKFRAQYNLSWDDFNRLLEEQNYSCAICKKPFEEKGNGQVKDIRNYVPNVDHDHNCCLGNKSCGECVRGLLCGFCNRMIGTAREDVTTLTNAVEYLNVWK